VSPRFLFVVLVAAGALVAGIAAAHELRGSTAPPSAPMVNVGSDGDPITAVRFDFVPEGTAPQPFLSDASEPGSLQLAAIADKLPTRLPDPGMETSGACAGVAITFHLRSGRELRYSRCNRPDAVTRFLRAVGVVPPWQ
jgi:hypothetical protein